MVVGAGSDSYRTLRHLVESLPAMIAPAWLKVPTQPIAIDAVLAYLTAAPDLPNLGRGPADNQPPARDASTGRAAGVWAELLFRRAG
jgi:hypothetical protein